MTPHELKARLDRGNRIQIIDVREPEEHAIANIGGRLIPLSELILRYQELDPDQETVLVCHHGIRSAQATVLLTQLGFTRVRSLKGGVDLWSVEIDPLVSRY